MLPAASYGAAAVTSQAKANRFYRATYDTCVLTIWALAKVGSKSDTVKESHVT